MLTCNECLISLTIEACLPLNNNLHFIAPKGTVMTHQHKNQHYFTVLVTHKPVIKMTNKVQRSTAYHSGRPVHVLTRQDERNMFDMSVNRFK